MEIILKKFNEESGDNLFAINEREITILYNLFVKKNKITPEIFTSFYTYVMAKIETMKPMNITRIVTSHSKVIKDMNEKIDAADIDRSEYVKRKSSVRKLNQEFFERLLAIISKTISKYQPHEIEAILRGMVLSRFKQRKYFFLIKELVIEFVIQVESYKSTKRKMFTKLISLMRENFIELKIDQDKRNELFNILKLNPEYIAEHFTVNNSLGDKEEEAKPSEKNGNGDKSVKEERESDASEDEVCEISEEVKSETEKEQKNSD